MKVCGIVTEYNPFHNGHIYHIQKARELSKCDVLIAVMSGNYTMRGDLSICDKFEKTKAALENGVDIVIELPYLYATQCASKFAKGAIDILKMLKVDSIVFGSETNNMEELSTIADTSINPDYLKEMLRDGHSYPKAYGLLSSSMMPNDILAVAYLKELKGSDIKPIAIQRTNDYHSIEINDIASASAIRNAIKENKEYKSATPMNIDDPKYLNDLYPYLQRLLMTISRQELANIHMVNEGIEKVFIDNAAKYDNFDSFIKHSISRRYTKSRIQRTILQIINHVTKDEIANLDKTTYARILGFNSKGQELLKLYKDDENINIITQFKNMDRTVKDLEYKVNCLYYSLYNNKKDLQVRELKGPIIIK